MWTSISLNGAKENGKNALKLTEYYMIILHLRSAIAEY
jgi:hypothetical protein